MREERAGLSASVIPSQAEVRKLVESVVEPGQQHVVRRDVLEQLVEINISVDELPYPGDELRLASVYLRLTGKQHDLVLDQIVIGGERHEPRVRPELDRVLQCPATGAIYRKQRSTQLRTKCHLDDSAVIKNRRRCWHDTLLNCLVIRFHPATL